MKRPKKKHRNPATIPAKSRKAGPMKNKKNKRRIINVDIVVIQVVNHKRLSMSRPCKHCLDKLQLAKQINIKINYVYYTDRNGEIIREKFNKMASTC